MLSKFNQYLAGIVAIAGLMLAAFLKGRSNGKREVTEQVQGQHTKDIEATATQRVETVKVVKGVQQETISSSDSTIDKELADRWTRG